MSPTRIVTRRLARRSSPRRRLGLLGRISLALVLVALLPLAAASYRLLEASREALAEQVLRTHAVAARTAAARVDAFLAARRFVADAAAESSALANDPASPAAADALAALLQAAPEVAALSLRAPGGEEVIRAQRPELASVVATVLAAPDAGSVAVVRLAGEPWVRLASALPGQRGTLLLVCDLEPLVRSLALEELGDQAELVLASRRGDALNGSAAALGAWPGALRAAALSGRLAGAGRYGEGDEAVLGAFAPVDQAPWVVLSRQPVTVAEVTARTLRRRALLACALAAALAVGGSAAARQTIVRPLRELLAAQRRVAGIDGRVDAMVERGEIAQLAASFAEIERRLREREALDEVFLGRYQVQAVVGQGAMGTVFRAWDPALERPVAIKTVRFDRALEGERRELTRRLLNEAVTVARLAHPNVVGVYDVQQSPEVAFLAMEYVDGISLERHLAARGRLDAAEAVTVALGIARALVAAHERGVVHHDVKPANVLLGRDGTVKVVDFGISQVLGSLADAPGTIFGTPGFLPPEALRGGDYGPPGDLFALGVTVYQMLTGTLPFAGRSIGELVRQTLEAEPPPPSARVAGVAPELDGLVAELLAKDLARRCGSAVEAARRLEALAVEVGSAACEPPPPARPAPAGNGRLGTGHDAPTRLLAEGGGAR
jgi:serine/threonine-protein kinase